MHDCTAHTAFCLLCRCLTTEPERAVAPPPRQSHALAHLRNGKQDAANKAVTHFAVSIERGIAGGQTQAEKVTLATHPDLDQRTKAQSRSRGKRADQRNRDQDPLDVLRVFDSNMQEHLRLEAGNPGLPLAAYCLEEQVRGLAVPLEMTTGRPYSSLCVMHALEVRTSTAFADNALRWCCLMWQTWRRCGQAGCEETGRCAEKFLHVEVNISGESTLQELLQQKYTAATQ
jgi:hypothetical protein